MFFKKKEEGRALPDLPPLKTPFVTKSLIEPPEEEEEESHSLPSFPDSPTHNRFSQAAIKDAVGEDKNLKTVEMKEWSPSVPEPDEDDGEDEMLLSEEPTRRRIEEPEETFQSVEMVPRHSRKRAPSTGDVFVRIDKFQTARNALEDAEEKLMQIDELIKKVRETKLREEQELSSWEKDISQIKARVQDISENIFEKIE